jgi:diguanylate cyclase (GGDEF)-like protein
VHELQAGRERAVLRASKSKRVPPSKQSGVIPSERDEAASTERSAFVAQQSVRSPRRATLVVMAGASAGQVFRVEATHLTIGRSKKADLELHDGGVSRLHCAIDRDRSGRCFVSDLGSTNGTLLNGDRVDRTELTAGDRLQLGPDVVLQFGFFDDAEEGLAVRLYEAATRDPLTRAYNRRHLHERLAAELSYAQRHGTELAAVIFDVDHFKAVNDLHGHTTGDEVLRSIAGAVSGTLRTEDVFARWGGEEFLVLARGQGTRSAARLAERIRSGVAKAKMPGSVTVTVSAGVASLADCQPRTADRLLALADERLYKAKKQGRNRVVAK